ncbi:MAG: conjugal transfer protein TraN [Rickettsiales bacterium]|nr:MAG: conjugal transfer protein TraN [Rickettsiales bacterium]
MQVKMIARYMIKTVMVLMALCSIWAGSLASSFADTSFRSNYPCHDTGKRCVSSGTRMIDGFEVHRDCWEYSYTKKCDYPSKDDCGRYAHCYVLGDRNCLLQDSAGKCVNMRKEFSCKEWDAVNDEKHTVRMGLEEKEGARGVVCKGVPCMDGNCVDKSYETNGEMMDSLSKLYSTTQMNPDKDGNFNLFPGSHDHCSKKAAGYSNCCRMGKQGWGSNLGAKCSEDEKSLMEQRSKNLCIYIGKKTNKVAGVTTLVKHHFCCFGTMLDKVVQQGARVQLGMSFGNASSANCRGLTLEEITRIDFSKIDFTEFIDDFRAKFAAKYSPPDAAGIGAHVESVMGDIAVFDENDPNPENNPENNMTGWRQNIIDEEWDD